MLKFKRNYWISLKIRVTVTSKYRGIHGCETVLTPGNIRYAPSLVARQGRGGTNIGTDVVSMEISPCFAR